MSDQNPSDQPSRKPRPESDLDAILDRDIDAALAHATSLTQSLSNQLGAPAGQNRAAAVDSLTGDLTDEGSSLDQELKHLDGLVVSTKEELAAPSETLSLPTSTSTKPTVPAFMDEFTQPAPVESPPNNAPSFMDEFTTASQESTVPATGNPRSASAATPPARTGPKTQRARSTSAASKSLPPRIATRVTKNASAVASSAAEGVVRALELMDKPVRGLKSRVRQIIGWLALAILAFALVLILAS